MKGNKNKALRISIMILAAWTGVLFVLYTMAGVHWFRLGDFTFHTAMAYHGLIIPAWMMLVLAYSRYIGYSEHTGKWVEAGAISGSVLTGIGSLFIRDQGFSLGTGIQVTGMILAEIVAWTVIIEAFLHYFKTPKNFHRTVWWTVTVALIGLSLATPLGHLAGAVKDLGGNLPIFVKHVAFLGMPAGDVLSGYIDSHSHQILAAFLAAGFALPLMGKTSGETKAVYMIEETGLYIIMIATIVQVVLYQYCAWFGWEPPDLFAQGPNGIPLDDFVLSVLGVGMLFLLPGLLIKDKGTLPSKKASCFVRGNVSVLLIAWVISVVVLGIYIEFHEQYFGHGEGTTLGVLQDQAYIRAHLLFGFLIIPVMLGALLHGNLLHPGKRQEMITGLNVLTIITGFAGVFVWVIFMNSLLLKIAVALTLLFLLLYSLLLTGEREF